MKLEHQISLFKDGDNLAVKLDGADTWEIFDENNLPDPKFAYELLVAITEELRSMTDQTIGEHAACFGGFCVGVQ